MKTLKKLSLLTLGIALIALCNSCASLANPTLIGKPGTTKPGTTKASKSLPPQRYESKTIK